jgi:hypothetical protein
MSGGRHVHEPSITDSYITVTKAQLAQLALRVETMEHQQYSQAQDTTETVTPGTKHGAFSSFIGRATLGAVIKHAMTYDTTEMPVRIDTIALMVSDDTHTNVSVAAVVPFRRQPGTRRYRPDAAAIYQGSGNTAAVAFAEMYGWIQDQCDTSDRLRLIQTDQIEPPQ